MEWGAARAAPAAQQTPGLNAPGACHSKATFNLWCAVLVLSLGSFVVAFPPASPVDQRFSPGMQWFYIGSTSSDSRLSGVSCGIDVTSISVPSGVILPSGLGARFTDVEVARWQADCGSSALCAKISAALAARCGIFFSFFLALFNLAARLRATTVDNMPSLGVALQLLATLPSIACFAAYTLQVQAARDGLVDLLGGLGAAPSPTITQGPGGGLFIALFFFTLLATLSTCYSQCLLFRLRASGPPAFQVKALPSSASGAAATAAAAPPGMSFPVVTILPPPPATVPTANPAAAAAAWAAAALPPLPQVPGKAI
jgi:hypothetical protein